MHPAFRHIGKIYLDKSHTCPHYGAIHEYLCFNNGNKKTQIPCKICQHTYSTNKTYSQQMVRKYPHCGNKLSLIKNRDSFDIYKCSNKKCSYYLQQRENLSTDDKRKYKTNPSAFSLHYITRVIGLTNDSPISKEHRPAKQIIKRLNRTFQYSYAVKNGFNTLDGANDFMCLFTTYFNFLRNHTTLNHQLPAQLESLKKTNNIPNKWNLMLDQALTYYTETTGEPEL